MARGRKCAKDGERREGRRDVCFCLIIEIERVELNHHDILVIARFSSAETVEGTALSLESVDNVECGDGLALGVFGVHDGVADNVLEEGSEDSAGLLIDVGRDSLHTTSACKSADSRLGDSEDGLTEGLATEVHSLGAGFTAAHAAFTFTAASADLSSWCHC